MEDRNSRTRMMLGAEGVKCLEQAHVVLFGLGGVGSYTAEALARAGVGELTLIDGDAVAESNINRQLPALCSTVGQPKVQVVSKRLLEINPNLKVHPMELFYCQETMPQVPMDGVQYVADAIDTVTSKILLIQEAKRLGVPVISCMGAGNKLDPTQFEVADISKTSVCPLARVMRLELKKRGITGVKTVFSKEPPVQKRAVTNDEKTSPGSVSFVPSVAGLILAGEIIKDIAGIRIA